MPEVQTADIANGSVNPPTEFQLKATLQKIERPFSVLNGIDLLSMSRKLPADAFRGYIETAREIRKLVVPIGKKQ